MRKLLSIPLCIILFITGALGSFTVGYLLLHTPETSIASEYLMLYTDDADSYYLQKAPPDIVFYIESDNRDYDSLFTLIDSEGNNMPYRTARNSSNQFRLLPPDSGYDAGKQYTLTLHNGALFSGNDLCDARELVFCIEKEAIETYEYSEEVQTLPNATIQFFHNDIIKTDDIAYQVGAILIDETEGEAYKIVEVFEDGTARIEAPSLDEIYSDLQIYGEYTWDVDEILWNDALEREIINNVRNSNFFNSLMAVAYAAEDSLPKAAGIKVECKENKKNNTMELKIEINLAPGKNGLFGISKLKKQEVTIKLETAIGFKLFANIDGPISNPSFDLSVTETNAFSWSFTFSAFADTYKKEKDPSSVINSLSEYQNIVGDLTKKLANTIKDEESGELKLFKWSMPVPGVPLVSFDAEVLLFAKLQLAADMTLGGHSSTINTSGIAFKNYKFRTYSDEYKTKSPISLTFTGKADFKTGIKFAVGAKIISKNVAYVGLEPQAGIYAELFATYPILKPEDLSDSGSILGLYGYFETGLYFETNAKAWVNLVINRVEYEEKLVKKKSPLLTFGNKKIAIGISSSRPNVRALNNTLTAPAIVFEYYDIVKGGIFTDVLDTSDVKFTANGQELKKSGNTLEIPSEGSASFYVTASYKNKGDNKSYSTLFKVIVSGSEIEGRVSEYTSGTNYNPIPGATVKLYSSNDQNHIISTTTTDTSGKFTFNVTKGKYVLKINASGYKELTSLQEIAEDETRFTEHILLVDNAQRGDGTAGGRVNNAIDGRDLEGVAIRLRENWNNRSGEYYRASTIYTGSNGQYRIEDVPVGYYTLEAAKDGFYTDYCNIIVHATDPQYDQNFTISPMLPEGQVRIVLRWDEHPRDLDSHLIGRTPEGSGFNVYYSDMHYSWGGKEMVNLDVDDTTSYGPETITILEELEDKWVYAVHDFTNKDNSESDSMSYSGAFVTVFTGGRQISSFHIPVGETGTYWTVFEYVDGQIRPVNVVNNIKPAP